MSLLFSKAHVATLADGHSATGERHVIRSTSDVSALVNHHTDNCFHASIIIAIALGGVFLDAYDLGALAFGIKGVTREFNLTPAATGMVASAITFGAIVGAFFGGYLTDKIGRYRAFMADMLFFVLAALACAFAPNEYVLTTARFVMGWAWASICRWQWRFWRSSPACADGVTKPPALLCGVPPDMPRSAFPIYWSCCCTACCQRTYRVAMAIDPRFRRRTGAGDYCHPQPLHE